MIEKADLLRVPTFEGLPDDQLDWFISQAEEILLKAGDTFLQQGTPAVSMIVVLEGQQQMRGALGGEAVTFPLEPPEISGLLPFSRMKVSVMTARAVSGGRILKFPSAKFPGLVQKMPGLAQRQVGMMADRIRETTRMEQQQDRLAALGKLSAGLAHELNNPASAAKRATSLLRDALHRIKDAAQELGRHDLTAVQRSEIEKLEASFLQPSDIPLDTLAITDLEDQIDSLLRSHGQNDLWQLAADLARRGVKPEALESLFSTLDADIARAALVRIAASVEIAILLNEIESSTARISDLVQAIKEYTYMDQAKAQNVDIVKGVENTLIIMNHKLKRGVTVRREYQKIPLLVNSYGSELNQAWTTIIDNAFDA